MTRAAPITSLLPIPVSRWLQLSGSDKQSPGRHQYGPTYDRLLRRFKWHRTTLAEVGIGGYGVIAGGESLAAWRSCLPLGRIIGCDIVDQRVLARRRVDIRVVDQGDKDQLVEFGKQNGPFDIVIDDGSHLNAHQILTFRVLWPFVSDGGVYVVEDVQTSYWPSEGGADVGSQDGTTCAGWFAHLAHYVNATEFLADGDPELADLGASIGSVTFEHNLVIVTKDCSPRWSWPGAPGQTTSGTGEMPSSAPR